MDNHNMGAKEVPQRVRIMLENLTLQCLKIGHSNMNEKLDY